MSARPERSCPRPALHDHARIALLLDLAHKLSRVPSGPLSLQLHDKNASVVLVHLSGQAFALHEGRDGGFDLGDVGGGVVALSDDEAQLGQTASATVLKEEGDQ